MYRTLETHGPRTSTRRQAPSIVAKTTTIKRFERPASPPPDPTEQHRLRRWIRQLYAERIQGRLHAFSSEQATPLWAYRSTIVEWYRAARRFTKLTGVEWTVMHEVPLKHPLVCGLHCPDNFQLVPLAVKMLRMHGPILWEDMP